MKRKTTIANALRDYLKGCQVGQKLTTAEIVQGVCQRSDFKSSSIIPTDFCHNRVNNGITFDRRPHFFMYNGVAHFEFVGEQYDYENGEVWHKPKSKKEYIYGTIKNGKLVKNK